MVRTSSRVRRTLVLAVGVCVAAGLTLAAPVHGATPSSVAARIMVSRLHKADHARHPRAHRVR